MRQTWTRLRLVNSAMDGRSTTSCVKYLQASESKVPLLAVRKVNQSGHVKIAELGATAGEPGHTGVCDMFEACHPEVDE